ncbi:MAG TPA: glycosyl hydrolase [Solirubrobacterales bacterium]|nr:glycosyl hydrolase [Solirubrobacterales bacterium]
MSKPSEYTKTIVRAWTALAAVAVAFAISASAAQALPAGFWGVVPQSSLNTEQFQRLGNGGVESIRIPVGWGSVQPVQGGQFDWSGFDHQVEEAAKAGIKVLPFLSGAPEWAVPTKTVPGAGGLKAPAYLPVSGAGRTGWAAFLTSAVARYGPAGSFWSEHPGVPKRPIRVWQIWNEPNFKYFIAKPNPTEYGKLVKNSYTALKAADPGAQVVLAGLFARPKGARTASGKHKSLNWYASDFVDRMYRTTPGLKTKFNGAALHPYTINARELPEVTEEFRDVLAAHKDAAKGLWVTELGWSSGKGSRANEFAKGVAGQARELKTSFTLLRNKQVKWKLKSIFWFSVDDAPGACNFCDGSGLFAKGFVPKKSWLEYVKFTGGTP